MHPWDSQEKHFDIAAFHFLALTSSCGLLSDKSQDQRFARREDGHQGNWGYDTSSSGTDCFCGSNETTKGHVYKVNNWNSSIESCGYNVFLKENIPVFNLGNKMSYDYI